MGGRLTSHNITLPKTNSEFTPENGWLEGLEDEAVSFWDANLRGRLLLVSGRVSGFMSWNSIESGSGRWG